MGTMKSHHEYAETMGALHHQMYVSHIRFQQSYDKLLFQEEECKRLLRSQEDEIKCLKKDLKKVEELEKKLKEAGG